MINWIRRVTISRFGKRINNAEIYILFKAYLEGNEKRVELITQHFSGLSLVEIVEHIKKVRDNQNVKSIEKLKKALSSLLGVEGQLLDDYLNSYFL